MSAAELNFAADHFALFGLPRAQAVDAAELDRCFREVQARVHPDKHAHAGDADQRVAMQWATRANEAYQTLRAPLPRARYLLQLLGHDPQVESNTAMPLDFLMQQMERREAVAEARAAGDEETLDGARYDLLSDMKREQQQLVELIDVRCDYAAAADLVRRLMFQEKLLNEIDDALEAVGA